MERGFNMLVEPTNQTTNQPSSNKVVFNTTNSVENNPDVAESKPGSGSTPTVNTQAQTSQSPVSNKATENQPQVPMNREQSTSVDTQNSTVLTPEKFNVVASQTASSSNGNTAANPQSTVTSSNGTPAQEGSAHVEVQSQATSNSNTQAQPERLMVQNLATKQGWQEEGGKTYYYGSNGQKVTGWQNNLGGNGRTQYFGTDGAQYKNGYYNIDGQTYYFDKDGNVVKGWQDNLPGASAPHYFDPQTGAQAKNGYWDINDKECYFDKDGNYVPNATDPYQNGAQTGVYRVPVTTHKLSNVAGDAIRGMDISSYEALKQAGVKFYNQQGQEEPLMKILHDNGINYIRLRIWNDPSQQVSWGWGGGNADEANELAIAKEAAQYGIKVMVDFHYSDWWSDPGTQAIPKAWQGENHQQLCDSMTKWTEKVLTDFKNAGADVGMVQIGNEITNGFMDVFDSRDKGGTYKNVWDNAQDAQKLCDYLNAGAKGVRAIDPNALVAIHLETPKADKYNDIMNVLQAHNVDYDVLGSSFYPYWQGLDKQSDFNDLKQCEEIAKEHGKYFAVLETAWPFTLEDSDGCKNNIGPNDTDISKLYPISPQGQADELEDVYATIMGNDNGLGAFYWEPAWIAVKAGTDNWNNYNSPANKKYGTESGWDNQAFFGDHGRALQSLNTYNQMVGENNQTYAKVEYVDDDTGKMSFGGFQRVTTGDNLSFNAPNGMKITKIDTEKPQNYDIWIQTPAQNKFHINNDSSWSLKSSLPGSETFVVHYTNNKNATADSSQTDTGSTSKPNTDNNKPATNNKPSSSTSSSTTNSAKPNSNSGSTTNKGSQANNSKPTTNSGSSTSKPNTDNKPTQSGSQGSSTSKPSNSSSSTTKPAEKPANGANTNSSASGSTQPSSETSGHSAQPANNPNDVNHDANDDNPSKTTDSIGNKSNTKNSKGSESSNSSDNEPVANPSAGNTDEDQPVQKLDGSKASNPDALVPDSNEPERPATSSNNGKPADGNSTANQGKPSKGTTQAHKETVTNGSNVSASSRNSVKNSTLNVNSNARSEAQNINNSKADETNHGSQSMITGPMKTNEASKQVGVAEPAAVQAVNAPGNSSANGDVPENNVSGNSTIGSSSSANSNSSSSKVSNDSNVNTLPETGMTNGSVEFAAAALALTGVAMLKRKEKE